MYDILSNALEDEPLKNISHPINPARLNGFFLPCIIFFSLSQCQTIAWAQQTPSVTQANNQSYVIGATLDEFSWLEGTWRGESPNGLVEQIWSEPLGESIIGTFRIHDGTKTIETQFYSLQEKEGVIELNICNLIANSKTNDRGETIVMGLGYQIAGRDSVFTPKVRSASNRIAIQRKAEDRYQINVRFTQNNIAYAFGAELTRIDSSKKKLFDRWPCVVISYGKGGGTSKIRLARPLSYYRENILPLDGELNWTKHHSHRIAENKIHFVGAIEKRNIYEIRLRLENDLYYDAIQIILLQREMDLYTPIYYIQVCETQVKLKQPWIDSDAVIARLYENAQISDSYDTRIRITKNGPTIMEQFVSDYTRDY